MNNLLCLTDYSREYRHLAARRSPRRLIGFSDVSICQGPNENMMRRIYGSPGRGEGWEGRGGRDGRRDGCRGRMKGEKIHCVLISGLQWGYTVLGAFYLDDAAAAAVAPPPHPLHPQPSPPPLLPSPCSFLSFFLCLSLPHFSSLSFCASVCV